MKFTEEQKEEIKRSVEECVVFMGELDNIKNDINETAKVNQEMNGLKAADFKKMVKIKYLDSLDEERAKTESFYDTYVEIMGS